MLVPNRLCFVEEEEEEEEKEEDNTLSKEKPSRLIHSKICLAK